ncbi:hypothetical protein Tco_1082478 [Tanacetum coccineum]|uniref:Copia protein n=1 Tax=Tanacetum coccineum TaxID=301880 RepID=A0ABQ5I0K0_9ASTR
MVIRSVKRHESSRCLSCRSTSKKSNVDTIKEDETHAKAPLRILNALFNDAEDVTNVKDDLPAADELDRSTDDSGHAKDYVDRKSTSGVCTLAGGCLTQWCCKKQTAVAISIIIVEYVAAVRACQQALWMKQAMKDYDIHCEDVLVLCDNKCTIDLSKNPVHHS